MVKEKRDDRQDPTIWLEESISSSARQQLSKMQLCLGENGRIAWLSKRKLCGKFATLH